jgi:nickel-dependent lactate racemase
MLMPATTAATILTAAEIEERLASGLAGLPLTGRRVLVLVPDRTRTMPLPLYYRLLVKHLRPRVKRLRFLVALGTHPPLEDAAMAQLLGQSAEERRRDHPDVDVLNHAWHDPRALALLGDIPAEDIERLSGGLFRQTVAVRLNREVLEHDVVLICGPVFPHEVAGFSGGNKYLFPGIAGAEIIHFTHWLGALITSREVIGRKYTPVRGVIDRAAALVPRDRFAICSVVTHEGVAGVFVGDPETAWSDAADLSTEVHIRWLAAPVRKVLAVLPSMYEDLWVGAKGMYKSEPVVADGGEVVIYAPHLAEISRVHGRLLREVGYHVRDYFVKQWDRFQHLPWGVLAHSTHLRGSGEYEAASGVERPRIAVTLATAIPEAECRAVNLGYADPATIDPSEWAAREDPGLLVIPSAGETLYRLRV